MDIYAIGRFCDRWIEKADSYRSGSLEDLFDRFFTLFVAYNRFYSAAAISYRAGLEERRAKMLRGDRREATTIMARLIGQPRFTAYVDQNPELAESSQAIADLLQTRQFFLHTVRDTDEPDLARDARLAAGLREHNLLAVLECLYQIRCNIFHGEKEFSPRQAELLGPAVRLLEAIVHLSKNTLRELG